MRLSRESMSHRPPINRSRPRASRRRGEFTADSMPRSESREQDGAFPGVNEGKRVLVPGHGGGCWTWYSDDEGATWERSNKINSPPHKVGGVHQGTRWNHGMVEATIIELKDKKLRYEDALNSVQSARELGVVPGGGACLAHIQDIFEAEVMEAMEGEDERQGAAILFKAMGAPCMQVAENAGIEGAVILAKVQALCREKGVSWYR